MIICLKKKIEVNKSTVVVVLLSILSIPTLLLTLIAGIFALYHLQQFFRRRDGIHSPVERSSLLSTWCRFDRPLFNPKQELTLEQLTIFRDHRLPGEDSESPHNEKAVINNKEKSPLKTKSPQFKTFKRNNIDVK